MKNKILKFALLSVSLLVGIAPAINANIPAIAAHFDNIPLQLVEMLSTAPSLFLVASVLSSSFIAKKIGYKQTIILGLAIVMISGIVPLFINNFYLILISRAALGFGIGLFNSLTVAMINYFYKDTHDRSKMYGLQTAFEGIGGISITFIAGQLIKISWQSAFIAYFIGVPVFLIYLFFVPKPETKDILQANSSSINSTNSDMKSMLPVFFYVFMIFISATLYMTYGIKIASLIISVGYGSASDASLVIIALAIGGIVAGVFFGKILEIFKKYSSSIGLLIVSISMIIISLSTSMPVTLIGGFLSGFGFKIFMPSIIDKINKSNISNKALATSLILVGFNLGSFISPYASVIYQKLAGSDSLSNLFIVLAIGNLILSIVFLLKSVVKTELS